MIINDCIIQAFLNDNDIHSLTIKLPMKIQTPDHKRKDVVAELNKQLHLQILNFPTYNRELWLMLFKDLTILQHLTIIPIVGYGHHKTHKQDDEYIIFLDLLLIADTTHIISQMAYLMQNHLVCESTRICIHEKYPDVKKEFHAIVDYLTFSHGLSNYLSWGENCKEYKFYTEKYEPYKEKAFSLLLQTFEVNDRAMQHKILKYAVETNFWNQFPGIAGMFYMDDIVRENSIQGIYELYKRGPENITKKIFSFIDERERG